MTWEIVLGIIALCTVGIAIGKIIAQNTAALTRMAVVIEEHEKRIKKLEDNNDFRK